MRGVPTSAMTSSRNSSRSDSSAACSCSRQRLRKARLVDQSVSSKARRAASMARRMSSADASATSPSTSSVAGLMLSKRLPEAASTSSPSMSMRISPRPTWLDMPRPLSDPRTELPAAARLCFTAATGQGGMRVGAVTTLSQIRPVAENLRRVSIRRVPVRRSARVRRETASPRSRKGAPSCDSWATPSPTRPTAGRAALARALREDGQVRRGGRQGGRHRRHRRHRADRRRAPRSPARTASTPSSTARSPRPRSWSAAGP